MRFVHAVTEKHFATAERVIAPYEKLCVSLADRVRCRDRNVFLLVPNDDAGNRFNRSGFFLNRFVDVHNACGVIYLHNTLFHCLPFMYSASQTSGEAVQDELLKLEFIGSLQNFFVGKKVSCISGTKNETDFFVDAIAKVGNTTPPVQINDYTLMSYKAGVRLPSKQNVTVQRARRKDSESLLQLHTGYVQEEVLPSCRTFNAASARYELEQLLDTRIEFFATNASGKVVAKGGIHSEGLHHAQIGGMYTLPEERSNGYAKSIMAVLVSEILQQKKQPTLFVKKANAPAISVYKKIGFVPESDYTIVYY